MLTFYLNLFEKLFAKLKREEAIKMIKLKLMIKKEMMYKTLIKL